jgi:hypothetical protein
LNGEGHGDRSKGPLQGLGQGNGQAPMDWAVIRTSLLEIMQEEGFTMNFQEFISGKDIKYVGFSFVNDCDLSTTALDPSNTYQELADHMQEDC